MSEILMETRHALRVASVALVCALKSCVLSYSGERLVSALGCGLMRGNVAVSGGTQRGDHLGNGLE